MGIIRLILAITVVLAHSNSIFGFNFLESTTAVQCFYIISGFYMSLVLNDKYLDKNNFYLTFITNRLLRILPTYWIIFLLTLLGSISYYLIFKKTSGTGAFETWFLYADKLSIKTILLFIFSNLFLVGQDIAVFMKVDVNNFALRFTSAFWKDQIPAIQFLFVPQAWTLGIELTFYFLIPLIIKLKSFYFIILTVFLFSIRFITYSNGLNFDPWTYRFLLFELGFFFIGVISHRFYIYLGNKKFLIKHVSIIFFLFSLLSILSYQFLMIPIFLKKMLLFLIISFSIPFAFKITKNNKLDRFIGEISYPLYISHYLIINFLRKFIAFEYLGIIGLIISIIVSFFLILLVIKPIEKIRIKISESLENKKNSLVVKATTL